MFLQYVHNVNAKVEEGKRYLSDDVKIALDKIDVPEDTENGIAAYSYYHVTAYPVVQVGTQTQQSVPVHPETVSKTITVPVYDVPATLKYIQRVKNPNATGDYDAFLLQEVEVAVEPIADEKFDADQLPQALEYYDMLYQQLHEGDDIRHYNRAGDIRKPYDTDNSRYPSF